MSLSLPPTPLMKSFPHPEPSDMDLSLFLIGHPSFVQKTRIECNWKVAIMAIIANS